MRRIGSAYLLGFAALLAFHFLFGWTNYVRLGDLTTMQTRYYNVLWPGIALAAAAALPEMARRWRGALLRDTARVEIDVLESNKRPVSAVADHFEVRNVVFVEIAMDHSRGLTLLHDPGHSLDERILREQFGY